MSIHANEILLEKQSPFIGRTSELAHVLHWLQKADASTEVVRISGMGGIGKSALLRRFLDMARKRNVRALWVNGYSCSNSVAGFLDALHAQMAPAQTSHLCSTRMDEIVDAIARQRTVLCIDEYDCLESVEGWLQGAFIPELPDTGFLIVLTARRQPASELGQRLAWQRKVTLMNLEPLRRTEVRRFFETLGMAEHPDIEEIIQSTHGHPLAMVHAADALQRRKPPSRTTWPVSHTVSASLLKEKVAPELCEALDVLSVLPQASQELLNSLLVSPLNLPQWQQLAELSFIQPMNEGISLHDAARVHLREDFARREPEKFKRLRQRIVTQLSQQSGDVRKRANAAATFMAIYREDLCMNTPFILPDNPGLIEFDSYLPGDGPHLHRLLEEEGFQQTTTFGSNDAPHNLLDEMIKYFPHNIRVFRDRGGAPAVFHAGLALEKEACEWVHAYHPQVLETCFGGDYDRIRRLSREHADTYFHLLGGADRHHPNHEFHELYGYMMVDGFSYASGHGMRLTMTSSWAVTKEYFQSLGCQTRSLSGLPIWHPANRDLVLEFDWREEGLSEWIRLFLERTSSGFTNLLLHATATQVKDALVVLNHLPALEMTALGRKWGGKALQQRLQAIVHDTSPATSLTDSQQVVLLLLSREPRLRPEVAAHRLNMSRSAYYRNLRNALNGVAQILSQV